MSDTPETDALYAQMLAENPSNFIHLEEFLGLACRLERERDEARAVAASMADIAFKRLASLLASTPHSKNAAHDEETQEVIQAIKRWKEMKQ